MSIHAFHLPPRKDLDGDGTGFPFDGGPGDIWHVHEQVRGFKRELNIRPWPQKWY